MKMSCKERTKMGPIRGKSAEIGRFFRPHRMSASGHRVIYLEDAEPKVMLLGRFEVDRSWALAAAQIRQRSMQQMCSCLLRGFPRGIATLCVLSLYEGLRVALLCCADYRHFIDTKSQSIPLYSLPFIRKRLDLLLFDMSYIDAQSLYEKVRESPSVSPRI